MKYRIKSKDFFAREEENGALSLIVEGNNRILFFNRMARRLLTRCDEWVDLAAFVRELGVTDVPQETVYRDFEKLLYKLEADELAELCDLPQPEGTGVRTADYRDARHVSEFLLANADAGFSCAVSVNPAYNALPGVYTRMQNGVEQSLLSEQAGAVCGLLTVSLPAKLSGNSAAILQSAVFPAQTPQAACVHQLASLLDYAATIYAAAYSKLRYVYMNDRQNALRDALVTLGFGETALLPNEVRGGRDMILYDRML